MYTALSLTCIVIEGFSTLEMHLLLFQLAEAVFFEHVMFASVDFLFIDTVMNVTCCVPSTGVLTVPVNRTSVVCAHDSHTGWCRHPFNCHGMMPCDLFPWRMFGDVLVDILVVDMFTCHLCAWQVFWWCRHPVDGHSYLWLLPMTGVWVICW